MSEMKSYVPDAWDFDVVLAAFREIARQYEATAERLEPEAAAAGGVPPAVGER
jgi:hypothetical protein